jgi:hypothetical protein
MSQSRERQLRANRVLMRRSKQHRYSITSSARASRVGGISTPYAVTTSRATETEVGILRPGLLPTISMRAPWRRATAATETHRR